MFLHSEFYKNNRIDFNASQTESIGFWIRPLVYFSTLKFSFYVVRLCILFLCVYVLLCSLWCCCCCLRLYQVEIRREKRDPSSRQGKKEKERTNHLVFHKTQSFFPFFKKEKPSLSLFNCVMFEPEVIHRNRREGPRPPTTALFCSYSF
jgi:hypothetical protein